MEKNYGILLDEFLTLTDESDQQKWLNKYKKILPDLVEYAKSSAQAVSYRSFQQANKIIDCMFRVSSYLNDPYQEALSWRAYAIILQVHEKYEEVLDASKKAADIYQLYEDSFQVAIAKTINVGALGALEKFDESIALALEIRKIFQASNFKFGEARITGSLARVYDASWELDKANFEYKKAYHLYLECGKELDAAWVHHNLGHLSEKRDLLEDAEQYYLKALPVFSDHEDKVSIVKTRFNLANIKFRQNQFDGALNQIGQAREVLDQLDTLPDHGKVDLIEAQVRQSLNQTDLAERLLRRAEAQFVALGRQIETAAALQQLGLLLSNSDLSEKIGEGLFCFERAEEILGPFDLPVLILWLKLIQSELLIRLGRTNEATQYLEQLIPQFEESKLTLRQGQAEALLGECIWQFDSDRALKLYHDAIKKTDDHSLINVRCWQGVGRIHDRAGDLNSAEAAYSKAIDNLDHIRRSLRSHAHQAGFMENKESLSDLILELALGYSNNSSKLFTWSERFKASSLEDLLVNQPPDLSINETQRKLLAERETISEKLDNHLFSIQLESNNLSAVGTHRSSTVLVHDLYQSDQVSKLKEQLRLIDEKIARDKSPSQNWRQGKGLSDFQLHGLLEEGSVLISYFSIRNQLYAITLTSKIGDVKVHPLNINIDDIRKKWSEYRGKIEINNSLINDAQSRLLVLYKSLIAPLIDRLDAKKNVIILPHRELFYIPFAGLYDGEKYLAEKWEIQIAASAKILSWCQSQPELYGESLLIGYPSEEGTAAFLPNVKKEIERIADLMQGNNVLFGADAKLETILDEMPNKQIIHFAGHATYVHQNPLESGMPLANSRWLRASDLYLRHNHIKGSIVVLSGCNTALGSLSGMEVLGLTSSFLYSGAASVIAGLWQVDDQATSQFMEYFYKYLVEGLTSAGALRQAQLDMLRDDWSHPCYWAPFMLNGHSRKFFNEPSN